MTLTAPSAPHSSYYTSYTLRYLHYARMILYYTMNAFDMANSERELFPFAKLQRAMGVGLHMFCTFVTALNCFAMARKNKRKRFFYREAKKYMVIIEHGVSEGVPMLAHMIPLLLAEEAALSIARKSSLPDKILRLYDHAATKADDGLFFLSKAIALERAGEYLLSIDDHQRAGSYLQRAFQAYNNYGAIAKLRQLRRLYGTRVVFTETDSVLKGKIAPFLVH